MALVLVDPSGDVSQGPRPQPARPPLRLPALLDEAGPFQYPQVLGDRGLTHVERCGQILDRRLPLGEPGQDRPPSRVGKSGEREAEGIGLLHGPSLLGYITCRYYTPRGAV